MIFFVFLLSFEIIFFWPRIYILCLRVPLCFYLLILYVFVCMIFKVNSELRNSHLKEKQNKKSGKNHGPGKLSTMENKGKTT